VDDITGFQLHALYSCCRAIPDELARDNYFTVAMHRIGEMNREHNQRVVAWLLDAAHKAAGISSPR
jgi:hypothetical protein